MAIEQTASGATVVTGAHIGLYALLALKHRLKLEGFGMKARGASALKIARDQYGLKGTRAKVLEEVERMIDNWQAPPEAE
jgi:hypothetical protein